jgi:hypothetical protein
MDGLCDWLMITIKLTMNYRNNLSKEQVINTDHHYCFMKPIRRTLGIYSLKIIINNALFQEIIQEPLSIFNKI